MKRMKAIACVDNNWAIGKDNKLLFNIPKDMKFFKEMTIDNVIIMGNNTFKSLGEKPLPNRTNVVLTSKIKGMIFASPNLIMADAISIEDYIDCIIKNTDKDIYIIGGESIYKMYLHRCHDIYLTFVDDEVEGADAHFPHKLMYANVAYKETLSTGEHNNIRYTTFHFSSSRPE